MYILPIRVCVLINAFHSRLPIALAPACMATAAQQSQPNSASPDIRPRLHTAPPLSTAALCHEHPWKNLRITTYDRLVFIYQFQIA